MIALLFIISLVVLGACVVATVMYTQSRNAAREEKNYERGLKMVPLLIHLPPISDDTDAGNRDVREVIDENVSKAQIIYNIIASTFEKGWRSRRFGQRHFAFEIIGSKGFVSFYATVPVGLVEVVRQAVVSAYPSARLEEVADHNIFSSVGKINATAGGELDLKEAFAYPIATYQDLKRDAMQALLNALSTLGKEDGAAIQILMRPADSSWRKMAHDVASKKRKGKEDSKGAAKYGSFLRQLAVALAKPPEHKDDKKEGKELSGLDQSILDAIDDKTRHPGYEVLIRVVASSNISQRAQAILGNMVAAFALFDAQGKNGFKFSPAKSSAELATEYILRLFPQQKNNNILNAVELATIFHFPDQRSIPTSQLERQDSKQVDGPRNMPDDGQLLGYNVFRGVKKAIRISPQDRQRHMYVVGQTGTGKSTYLENLALQDMLNGNGFAFVDPHGDTAEKLLSMVPRERTEDIIYFSPADMEYPMGLNLFEFHTPDQKDFLIQEVLNMLQKLYDPQHTGIMGPRYEDMFRNAALAVMADPNGSTFIEIPQLFRDPQFLKNKLQYVKDQTVLDFWQKQFPASQRSNEAGEVTAWFLSKFGAFLSNEMMRNIIGQTKSAFNLRDIMDNKKILLVNLSKGRTGELNSKLLGMVFVMKFQAAAMSRANIPESERQDFSLYVDEFQNFSTDSFATIMSEARKYHLNLIVANQFTTQLTEEIRDAVFGNMGTIVAFRVGQNDVDSLSRYFQPTFDADDLLRVPNYNTITRTLVNGVPTQPFSMATLPPLGSPNAKLSAALKQLSAAKYGRPKAAVEKDIFARMATKQPVGVASGAAGASAAGGFPRYQQHAVPPGGAARPRAPWPGAPAPTAAGAPPQARPQGTAPTARHKQPGPSSFLDDWLNKSKQGAAQAATPPATSRSWPPAPPRPTGYASQPSSFAPSAPQNAFGPIDPASAAAHPMSPAQHVAPTTAAASPRPTTYATSPQGQSSDQKQSPADGHLAHGDTIFIDQDGNMRQDD